MHTSTNPANFPFFFFLSNFLVVEITVLLTQLLPDRHFSYLYSKVAFSDTQLQEGQRHMRYDLLIYQHFHLKRNQEIKKSRNEEIKKSQNQEIKKSIQFYTHWSFPVFPSHLDPFWTSTTGDRTSERRTLSTARSTASLPLLADFHTASIIPFPSITRRISPSKYNLNNHSNVGSMTFAEAESRASRRGWKTILHRIPIIPTLASSNSDPTNLRGFRSCQAQIYNLNQTAPTLW